MNGSSVASIQSDSFFSLPLTRNIYLICGSSAAAPSDWIAPAQQRG
jgi:hypothetical protein